MNLEKLYNQALSHREEHNCSAYPYESYQKLFDIVLNSKPQKVLEIGSGIGFSTAVIALAAPEVSIDTIEKDEAHCKLTRSFLDAEGIGLNIAIHNEVAESFLEKLTGPYDLIFFDGYQIHYEFLPHYERLLPVGGILVLGNNHLASRTSTQFFHDLVRSGRWEIVEQFGDTTVAKRTSN